MRGARSPQDETAAGRARGSGQQGQFVFHLNSSVNGDHVHRMKAEDGVRTALRSEGTKVGSGPHGSPPTVPTRCHPGHKAPAQRTCHVSLFFTLARAVCGRREGWSDGVAPLHSLGAPAPSKVPVTLRTDPPCLAPRTGARISGRPRSLCLTVLWTR